MDHRPGSHVGDFEADLAMTQMFGSLPERFYAAYNESESDRQDRICAAETFVRSVSAPESSEYIRKYVSWKCCGYYKYVCRGPDKGQTWMTEERKI